MRVRAAQPPENGVFYEYDVLNARRIISAKDVTRVVVPLLKCLDNDEIFYPEDFDASIGIRIWSAQDAIDVMIALRDAHAYGIQTSIDTARRQGSISIHSGDM